jgi:hypothetical protein
MMDKFQSENLIELSVQMSKKWEKLVFFYLPPIPCEGKLILFKNFVHFPYNLIFKKCPLLLFNLLCFINIYLLLQ